MSQPNSDFLRTGIVPEPSTTRRRVLLTAPAVVLAGVVTAFEINRGPRPLPSSIRIGRAASDWGVFGVPEPLHINAAGTIVDKEIGTFTLETAERTILPMIAELRP